MKKMIVVAVLIAAGVAFASSLSVPWFVDTGSNGAGFPPTNGTGVQGIVYLHNNLTSDMTCAIAYYSGTGMSLGPAAPDNTFTIPANSTVAFRPVADDPSTVGGGQESAVALAVPNRPILGTDVGDGSGAKKNGSLVVAWVGGAGDVQGLIVESTNVDGSPSGRLLQYGTLLPPGV